MKIYTRTGDEGDTGLFGGGRVPKAHHRVEAYGTVDELNAVLGVCQEVVSDREIRDRLVQIQKDLFVLGSSLATPGVTEGSAKPTTPPVPAVRVREMERWIDDATDEVSELRNFILPGGTRGSAFLHLARTVCRRAERAVVRLSTEDGVEPVVLQYLNRLSDLLFALARLENGRAGVADVLWVGDDE